VHDEVASQKRDFPARLKRVHNVALTPRQRLSRPVGRRRQSHHRQRITALGTLAGLAGAKSYNLATSRPPRPAGGRQSRHAVCPGHALPPSAALRRTTNGQDARPGTAGSKGSPGASPPLPPVRPEPSSPSAAIGKFRSVPAPTIPASSPPCRKRPVEVPFRPRASPPPESSATSSTAHWNLPTKTSGRLSLARRPRKKLPFAVRQAAMTEVGRLLATTRPAPFSGK
jgi:hypothetical protein